MIRQVMVGAALVCAACSGIDGPSAPAATETEAVDFSRLLAGKSIFFVGAHPDDESVSLAMMAEACRRVVQPDARGNESGCRSRPRSAPRHQLPSEPPRRDAALMDAIHGLRAEARPAVFFENDFYVVTKMDEDTAAQFADGAILAWPGDPAPMHWYDASRTPQGAPRL